MIYPARYSGVGQAYSRTVARMERSGMRDTGATGNPDLCTRLTRIPLRCMRATGLRNRTVRAAFVPH
jgi:hypothetical protein